MRFPATATARRAAVALAPGIAITLPGIAVTSAHAATSPPGAAANRPAAAPEAYGTWD